MIVGYLLGQSSTASTEVDDACGRGVLAEGDLRGRVWRKGQSHDRRVSIVRVMFMVRVRDGAGSAVRRESGCHGHHSGGGSYSCFGWCGGRVGVGGVILPSWRRKTWHAESAIIGGCGDGLACIQGRVWAAGWLEHDWGRRSRYNATS